MSTFSLKIVACNKVFYDGECEILIYPAYDGHEQMTSTVEIGEIKFKLPDGTWMNAIVSDGLVEVDHNKVDVLVYSAEKPEEIDKFRAEAALERAKEQLRTKQSIMEYHISQASLSRAMARLKGARGYK